MAAVTLRRIRTGARLHRIHRPHHDPVFFGPPGPDPLFRFDAPAGNYKVLYAARTLETAFGEALVRSPAVPYVTSSAVQARVRSELITTRTLKLYPLIDAGVSAHGLSFTDLHGDAYAKTWQISAQIHETSSADGILYPSRFDNQVCVALFERAADAVVPTAVSKVTITPAQATILAHHFGKIYVEP